MLKMKGGNGGGGGGKSKKKGGADKVVKSRALQTSSDALVKLRNALRLPDGKDKNVLSELAPFCKYDRNGLDVVIDFTTGSWAEKPKLKAMAQLTNPEDLQEKLEDFRDPSARFFVASAREGGELVGFAHVRFTLQGEVAGEMAGEPVLLVCDLYLREQAQRKGLGKHLMTICDLVARKNGMQGTSVAVLRDHPALPFFAGLRGYAEDAVWSAEDEAVLAKMYLAPPAAAAASPAPAAQPAAAPVAAKAMDVTPDSVLDMAASAAAASPSPAAPAATAGAPPASPAPTNLSGAFEAVAPAAAAAAAAAPAADVPFWLQVPAAGAAQPAAAAALAPVAAAADVPFWMQVPAAPAAAAPAAAACSAMAVDGAAAGEGLNADADGSDSSDGEEGGEEEDGEAAELDAILDGLCGMFREKHGRDPTPEEVQIWMTQLREAAADGGLDM